jgi:hypothetical protein
MDIFGAGGIRGLYPIMDPGTLKTSECPGIVTKTRAMPGTSRSGQGRACPWTASRCGEQSGIK